MKSVAVIEMNRGTTRNVMGSMARTRRASICSVPTMVPSSAVLLAPTRPEIISAVSSGAISRRVPKPAAHPMRPSAPRRFTMGAAWMTMMAPVKSAVTTTMGNDLTLILYMLRRSSG